VIGGDALQASDVVPFDEKRGIVGTFHNVSKRYLHLYVAEFQFRYNNRFNDDIFGTAIEGLLALEIPPSISEKEARNHKQFRN
jgi:hypothetical protein